MTQLRSPGSGNKNLPSRKGTPHGPRDVGNVNLRQDHRPTSNSHLSTNLNSIAHSSSSLKQQQRVTDRAGYVGMQSD